MNRNAVFWGTVLILIGILALLDNLGAFGNISVWAVAWPLFLVLLGAWLMWGNYGRRRYGRGWWSSGGPPASGDASTIPLQGASRAHLRLRHGAGRLNIERGAGAGDLAAGTFGGGLDYEAKRNGDGLDVVMLMRGDGVAWAGPWTWGHGGRLDWDLRLNGDVPLEMEVETGASDSRIDLSGLQVTDLRLRTGASSTDLTPPARGQVQASVEGGAASMRIHIPAGVAARIRTDVGLSEVTVDTARFPGTGDMYVSPGFDTAGNRVDITIKMGMGSITVG